MLTPHAMELPRSLEPVTRDTFLETVVVRPGGESKPVALPIPQRP